MNVLKGFLPWIIYSLVASFSSSLYAAFAAISIYAYQFYVSEQQFKMLDYCSVPFFFLTIIACKSNSSWMLSILKSSESAFLASVVLISILVKKPFTLAYAKEITPPEYWSSIKFFKINMWISGFWLGYFLLQILASQVLHLTINTYYAVHALLLISVIYLSKAFPRWYVGRDKLASIMPVAG